MENYPRLRPFSMTILPRADQIGRGLWMGTVIGVYEFNKEKKVVVCYSADVDFCSKCPLFSDCPRPFGFKEPRHNNSIPAEKVKLSIV